MAAERPKRVVKKPKRFVEEFSRSMTVKKTETQEGDKKLYDVEVTEVDKFNKRIKRTQFDEWRFFGGDEGPTISTYFQIPFPEPNLSPI